MSCFDFVSDRAASLCDSYRLPEDGRHFHYGTAGFRAEGSTIVGVAFRVGVLAALRAQCVGGNIGVMITASHNPHKDNGVKIVEPLGEMLISKWEGYATDIANAKDHKAIAEVVKSICAAEGFQPSPDKSKIVVIVGRDTRPSGVQLTQAVLSGLQCAGQQSIDLGVLTTPQCHFCVRESNLQKTQDLSVIQKYPAAYISNLTSTFAELMQLAADSSSPPAHALVDCANGVGTNALRILQPQLKARVLVDLGNDRTDVTEVLNHQCGADFVQKEKRSPFASTTVLPPGAHLVSLDGDADRVVYIDNVQKGGACRVVDGDNILVLFCAFIRKQLDALPSSSSSFTIGAIQTAYANGASTRYLADQLKVKADCVATGIKHLANQAKLYDIGVYFEANGHGTVIFSDRILAWLKEVVAKSESSKDQKAAAQRLLAMAKLLLPTVGDAIGDFLMIEACLRFLKWDVSQWKGMYTDLPSRQQKIHVANPQRVKTIPDETKTTAPDGLQAAIDKCVGRYAQGRSFVRPSGTEPVVRVYAEASTEADAKKLADEVEQVVLEILK